MPQLTKREIAWFLDGLGGTGRVIEYRVQGPSPADEAFIANFGSCYHDRWKILRVKKTAQTLIGMVATPQQTKLSLHSHAHETARSPQ